MRKRKQISGAQESDVLGSTTSGHVTVKKSKQDALGKPLPPHKQTPEETEPQRSKKHIRTSALWKKFSAVEPLPKTLSNNTDSVALRRPEKRLSCSLSHQFAPEAKQLCKGSVVKHSTASGITKKQIKDPQSHTNSSRPNAIKKNSKETGHVASHKKGISKSSTGRLSAGKGKGKSKQEGTLTSPSHSKKDTSDNALRLEMPMDLSDPMAMLMMMEGSSEKVLNKCKSQHSSPSIPSSSFAKSVAKPWSSTSKSKKTVPKRVKRRKSSDSEVGTDDSGSEGMSDWEDVYDHPEAEEKSQVSDKPVEITLDLPDILKHKKRKRKEFDWKGYLERRVRRFKKEVAMDMHKVHLLCLLSLGLRQNEELNDLTLSGQLISVLPARLATVVSDCGSSGLERRVEGLLMWYKKSFSLEHVKMCSNVKLVPSSDLVTSVSERTISDARIWVLVFICILRTIGLSVRLVLSFHAIPFKGSQEREKPGPSGNKEVKASKDSLKPQHKTSKSSSSSSKPSTSKPKSSKSSSSLNKSGNQSSKSGAVELKKDSTAKRKSLSRASSEVARKKMKEVDEMSEEDSEDGESKTSEKEGRKPARDKKKKLKEKSREDEDLPGSESEFEDTSSYFCSPSRLRKDLKILSNRKVLSPSSSDGEESSSINRSTIAGHDFWLEIYFPEKKRWICFDCFKGQFGKPYSLENSASPPLSYVVAFKNDGGVKDVTARYAKLWLSHTRKQRGDQDWWEETLAMFCTTSHRENMLEDDEIKGQLLVRPMPTSIADFKNHPLYALRRHLLKFEAIYPDTAIPLGYIKKEPIYARECVHTLHSRDNWLKEGRLVRLAEQPYKMVKSRPKWNKPKDNPDELDLETYGEWQTEKYIPPPAVNGKVPKNEYGNLELFKPWMLPLGTVQLKVNGLQRVAKKLGIDVAPAMVGWDHHSGHAHPVFDGVVVCEEYADTLMAAWTEDQEIQEQREIEKREKRVYGNWRLLIRGLLIKMRLTQKFSQADPSVTDKKEKLLRRVEELKRQEEQEHFSDAEPALDVQHSWPRRQQDEVKTEKAKKAKLKVEAAQRLLEKGTKQGKTKAGVEEMDDNVTVKDAIQAASVRVKEKFRSVYKENGGKNRQILQSRASKKKGQRGPRDKAVSIKSSEEGSDSEDEIDGEKLKTNTKKIVSQIGRPKRRSSAAVKYFNSDEEDDDFVDDSDRDADFDLKAETREKFKQKSKSRENSIRNWLSEESSSSDEDANSRAKTKVSTEVSDKTVPAEFKKHPDRHWLDEDGSSSDDDDDFIAVETNDALVCTEKELDVKPLKEKVGTAELTLTDNKEDICPEEMSQCKSSITGSEYIPKKSGTSFALKHDDCQGTDMVTTKRQSKRPAGARSEKVVEEKAKKQVKILVTETAELVTEVIANSIAISRKKTGLEKESKLNMQTESHVEESLSTQNNKNKKTTANNKGNSSNDSKGTDAQRKSTRHRKQTK